MISPTNFNKIVKKSWKNTRRCQAHQSFGVFEHFVCSCVHDFSLIVAPNLSLQARSAAAWLEHIELTPFPVKGTHKGQRMIGCSTSENHHRVCSQSRSTAMQRKSKIDTTTGSRHIPKRIPVEQKATLSRFVRLCSHVFHTQRLLFTIQFFPYMLASSLVSTKFH